eukprot:scaffold44606_cov176-Amphora_coffeaeformis.AAC.2
MRIPLEALVLVWRRTEEKNNRQKCKEGKYGSTRNRDLGDENSNKIAKFWILSCLSAKSGVFINVVLSQFR